jgi:hypothetical protein
VLAAGEDPSLPLSTGDISKFIEPLLEHGIKDPLQNFFSIPRFRAFPARIDSIEISIASNIEHAPTYFHRGLLL